MNEKFWEIVEQADEQGGDDPDIRDQVFAELLIKAAGEHLMSPEFIGRSDLDWSMVLNEYFGVEE
jgi:hypothetical protein